MARYLITLDGHKCRAIEADDWRDAVGTAVQRVYGKRAFPMGLHDVRDGFAYIDVFRSDRRRTGDAAHRIAAHVALNVYVPPHHG